MTIIYFIFEKNRKITNLKKKYIKNETEKEIFSLLKIKNFYL